MIATIATSKIEGSKMRAESAWAEKRDHGGREPNRKGASTFSCQAAGLFHMPYLLLCTMGCSERDSELSESIVSRDRRVGRHHGKFVDEFIERYQHECR